MFTSVLTWPRPVLLHFSYTPALPVLRDHVIVGKAAQARWSAEGFHFERSSFYFGSVWIEKESEDLI